MSEQLDIFTSSGREPLAGEADSDVGLLAPVPPVTPEAAATAEPASRPDVRKRTQMIELAGETWEDAFGSAA